MYHNTWISRDEADSIKKRYPVGTRLILDHMEDPYSPIEPGTHGTVEYVDDQGQLHMKWDNGRTLALIPGIDCFNRE